MLRVTKALPDPVGKDRQALYSPSNEQLNQEWVEFANLAPQSASVEGVSLSNYTFDGRCQKTGEDQLMTLTGAVQPGHSVRFHTGSGVPYTDGPIRHLYVGRTNYAWNNRCGDTAVLRNARAEVLDWASYDPNPPEGIVLLRLPGTNKLSAVSAAQTA